MESLPPSSKTYVNWALTSRGARVIQGPDVCIGVDKLLSEMPDPSIHEFTDTVKPGRRHWNLPYPNALSPRWRRDPTSDDDDYSDSEHPYQKIDVFDVFEPKSVINAHAKPPESSRDWDVIKEQYRGAKVDPHTWPSILTKEVICERSLRNRRLSRGAPQKKTFIAYPRADPVVHRPLLRHDEVFGSEIRWGVPEGMNGGQLGERIALAIPACIDDPAQSFFLSDESRFPTVVICLPKDQSISHVGFTYSPWDRNFGERCYVEVGTLGVVETVPRQDVVGNMHHVQFRPPSSRRAELEIPIYRAINNDPYKNTPRTIWVQLPEPVIGNCIRLSFEGGRGRRLFFLYAVGPRFAAEWLALLLLLVANKRAKLVPAEMHSRLPMTVSGEGPASDRAILQIFDHPKALGWEPTFALLLYNLTFLEVRKGQEQNESPAGLMKRLSPVTMHILAFL